MRMAWLRGELRPQLTAFFTSAPILASSAAVNPFSAKAVGHRAPSSRFALSLKPSVAYLVLNFCALWKKQTTLPSLPYAVIPYHSVGEQPGALNEAFQHLGPVAQVVRSRSDVGADGVCEQGLGLQPHRRGQQGLDSGADPVHDGAEIGGLMGGGLT